jgi:branched-chain amino acid aminotransferase
VIFTCAVGQYYPAPLRLLVTTDHVRVFPGGTGNVKPAGNYAPALLAEAHARHRGFSDALWLDGRERRFVEEAGVMNVFFVIGGTVVTPGLSDTILPGITRDSVITLLEMMGIPVEEWPVSIDEIAAAHATGRLRECFGTGTAATISHVVEIGY